MVQHDARQVVDRLSARQLSLKKPVRPWDKALTDQIADLKLHPAIESGLHLLNDDIVSAHFLVRHAQNQAITDHWHGILHRLENDFRNSRLWYQNRITEETRAPYFDSLEAAQKFVWDCQNVVVNKNSQGHDIQALESKGMQEVRGLLKKAIDEFGLAPRADVSEYYGSSEADRETKLKMTTNQVRREGHENE